MRALRICSKEYLQEEIEHIYKAFEKLRYPKGFLIQQKEKAMRIKRRNDENSNREHGKEERTSTNKKTKRYISIPNSSKADIISRELEKTNIKITTKTGLKIQEISKTTLSDKNANEKSVVYEIPCKGCERSYVGETGRGIDVRLKEHRNDVKYHRMSNAIVLHIEKCNHLPDWSETRILERNIQKQTRKTLEAAHIITRNTFNSRSGFISLSSWAAKLAVS